ncbi:hypothetical protein [Bauldia sp.]|uniref:hypothetical protein n=1 Tax=Bauldia sp. TaxID=2575872 RepID=UPI003BABE196
MTARILLTAAIAAAGLSAGPAFADDDWAGLYTAIDGKDGSVDRLSIVPNSNGTFTIHMTSTGLSLCADAGDNTAGWINATGRLAGKALLREHVRVTCAATGESRDIASSRYAIHEVNDDILMMRAPDDGRALYYHRVSDD